MSALDESMSAELPALLTFPEEHLYGQVEGSFNFSSLTQTFKMVKCQMCGAAVSHDDDSLNQHRQFHIDLAALAVAVLGSV